MFKATAAVFSKASRRALTPKRGNKDFYKGTRQAYLPGGLRTGAPGKHVVKGKAKYRLLDEQVRVFVAPAIEDIVESPLRPYVYSKVKLTKDQKHEVLGKFPQGGITGEHLLKVAPKFDGIVDDRYPEVDELVMVQVRQIAEMGAYVKLLEYDNIEGMILLSELSRRRIRSIQKLIRVGRNEVVVVLRVDKEKGYIDLSKRRVSPEDIVKCEERYMKAKTVASIMRHVASKVPSTATGETDAVASSLVEGEAPQSLPESSSKVEADDKSTKKSRRAARKHAGAGADPEVPNVAVAEDATDVVVGGAGEEERLEQLYDQIAWPLGRKYGHPYDAFKLALTEPDTVFSSVSPIVPSTRSILIQTIARRLTPQAIKLRADIELTCYTPAGIDAIKRALRAGEMQSNETVPIKAKLVAPPLYVLSTNATDKFAAVDRLERAIESIQSTIENQGGSLVIKMKPKAISETEEQDLAQLMAKAGQENAEISGDEDEEDEVI